MAAKDGGHENVIGDSGIHWRGVRGEGVVTHHHIHIPLPPPMSTSSATLQHITNPLPPRQWIPLSPMTFSWPPSWQPFAVRFLRSLRHAQARFLIDSSAAKLTWNAFRVLSAPWFRRQVWSSPFLASHPQQSRLYSSTEVSVLFPVDRESLNYSDFFRSGSRHSFRLGT